MIVPMKKIWLLTLKNERDRSLQQLQKLGVVEVVSENVIETVDRTKIAGMLNLLDRVIAEVSSRNSSDTLPDVLPVGEQQLVEFALQQLEQMENAKRDLDILRKEYSELQPWGNYDPQTIQNLSQQGIYVYLCSGSIEQYENIAAEQKDAVVQTVESAQGMVRFVVISPTPQEPGALPEVVPGERPLAEVEKDIAEVNARIAQLDKVFDAMKSRMAELKHFRNMQAAEAELLKVRDGLTECGELVALKGFVPQVALDALLQAAQENAWALTVNDPDENDVVPVLLEPPRWVKPILPLFQFLGIAPGYDEFDMSPGMLIFFSIFFSMIINDGGYALLMLALSITAAVLLRKNPQAAMPCRLALILSLCASVWGICNGAYFGMEFAPMQFFAAGKNQTANLQLVCFVLALVHLSLGHCWRLVNVGSVREAVGQLGWIPILLLDFMVVLSLLVYPGMALPAWALIAGAVGLVMVLAGGVDWRDVGAICNLPFDLIGSFTDTLSYVRLFAVGMSGTYMAQSFNSMGVQLWEISPWLIPVGLVVILFGHTLNAALAFMSVLVHGVRLNTLEFSNHAGIRWGGQAFKPLKKFE
ncbi:MAG: hypothetical protein E7052_11060 [Lentisphaerae bacterium]|nr:hypothetical protein [Lentisphaerota bacterium]